MTKPEKNLSQVRQVWKRQQRDERGRFAKFEIFENEKGKTLVEWPQSDEKFDYSADKRLVDTLVQASDNSSRTYQFSDIEKAFYAGTNASSFYSQKKQFEIFCKNNNYEKM